MHALRAILLICAMLLVGMPAGSGRAAAQGLRVVTTTSDLADIARAIGGNRVEVRALAPPQQDPHFVEARPSLVLELRNADLFAQIGLDLEVGWAPLLVEQSRNSRIQRGRPGHLDLSMFVAILDVPAGRVTRAEGDVHPGGNPHYWLSPANGRRIGAAFARRLTEMDPDGAALYQRNLNDFDARLQRAMEGWSRLLEPFRGAPIVAYHASFRYLLDFAGLSATGFIEPLPGIPPSPRHLAELIDTMNRARVGVILMETFYDRRVPTTVAERTGARLLVVPSSVGATAEVGGYVELIDHLIRNLVDALRRP